MSEPIVFFEYDENVSGRLTDKIKRKLRSFKYPKIEGMWRARRNEEGEEKERYIFEFYEDRVKANGYIGFAIVDGAEVMVLPKVAKNVSDYGEAIKLTLAMIGYTCGLNIRNIVDREKITIQKMLRSPTLYEVLVFFYAKALLDQLYLGRNRDYRYVYSEEKYLKGKLVLTRQILKPPYKWLTFNIYHARYSIDNLLNRIFFYTANVALKKTFFPLNKRLLKEIISLLDEAYCRTIDYKDLERVVFTRTNERFRTPYSLARIILRGLNIYRAEKEAYGFFIDTSWVFEYLVYKALMYSLKGYAILYQEKLAYGSRNKFVKEGNSVISMIPDMIIKEGDEIRLVIDVKYKELKNKKPSSNDIYQAYSYLRAIQACQDSPSKLVLVYPKYGKYNEFLTKKPMANKSYRIKFFDDNEIILLPYNLEHLKEFKLIDEDFIKNIERILKRQ